MNTPLPQDQLSRRDLDAGDRIGVQIDRQIAAVLLPVLDRLDAIGRLERCRVTKAGGNRVHGNRGHSRNAGAVQMDQQCVRVGAATRTAVLRRSAAAPLSFAVSQCLDHGAEGRLGLALAIPEQRVVHASAIQP